MKMRRGVPVLSVNAFETRKASCKPTIAANVSETSKRKRGLGEDWRNTKRIKTELQQVDLLIQQIDEVCKKEGISKPKVLDNKTIDDLIADIDKAIAEANTTRKALFGDKKGLASNPKPEIKKEFAKEPVKIEEEKFKMKPSVSPLTTKIFIEAEKPCAMVAKVAVKRKAPEEKKQAPMAEEKPKKKFKFIPVSFP